MASKKKDEKTVIVPKSIADLQRIKLEKLMKNPTKEIVIPDRPKDWQPKGPQEFIRNVWGSSAGAGSGDFHVYRGIRRREYARQKFLNEKTSKDTEDEAYERKVIENQKVAEVRTAKKRAKRLKKKEKMKEKKKQKVTAVDKSDTKVEEDSDESDEDEKEECSNEDNEEKTVKENDQSIRDGETSRNDKEKSSPQSDSSHEHSEQDR